MLEWLVRRLMNAVSDDVMGKMLIEKYSENLLGMGTAAGKLGMRAIVEAGIRGQDGKILERPLGSPNLQSPWEKIFLNPTQLFALPTDDGVPVKTEVVIGKKAKKPLKLNIPIMVTGMSYGGSLSLNIKTALARGASLVGTATNTGESALTAEEREAAGLLIGQYHRGGWMNTEEHLSRLDAIEVQLGQGAWGGAVPSTVTGDKIGEHLREAWHLKKGEDGQIKARLDGINTPDDIVNLLNQLKERYEVPVGIKIAATHFIESELDVILRSKADFIVIDGAEGGTAGAPPTLEDDMGLPTLYALSRTARYLEKKGVKNKYDLIITGGLRTPGHFLKAMALGANAVYIGSIAIIAVLQNQVNKALPSEPPAQLSLYDGKLADDFDVEQGTKTLANFINSCVEEMKLALIAMGKTSATQLGLDDLVAVNKELSEVLGIGYAGYK